MKKIKLYHILIFLCLIGISVFIWISACGGVDKQVDSAVPVHIIGRYSVDAQEALELTEDTYIDSGTLHTVKISGHFSSGIPEGRVLFFWLDNISASIKINGREVFGFGSEDTIPSFTKSAGNTWGYYISPGITESDKVEITLQNVYTDMVANVFGEFLHGMSYGHGFELYQTMLRDKMPAMLFGFFIFVAGIIVFVVCAVAGLLKAPGMGRGMALSCVTITGGIWVFIDGGYPYVPLLFNNPLLFNAIDVLQIFVVSVVLLIFTFTCLESKNARKIAQIITEIALSLLLFAILAQIIGLFDLYEIQGWAIAIGFFAALASIMLLGYEALVLRQRQTLFILLSWLPFFISGLAEIFNYFLRFMPGRAMIKYGFALSVLLQFIQLVHAIRGNVNRTRNAVRLEYDLLQSRMAVMLSQIQPHFLLNTLNDIRFLYRESPQQAEIALVSFTRYLRGNMDSLNQVGRVPFEQELNHLKNYIEIEKIRFGDRLNVVFELGCTGFTLPILTLQTLVENAIRHGVTQKREGGTVTIRTFENEHDFIIEVSDDGIGFDPSVRNEDGESHNGINNVRMRLQTICGGSLEIKSRINEGTTSMVCIPKEKQK